ncbi:MAG: FG-GAP repeat domain-containing protein, partial [Candidatus Thorarchaeota archaeon]
DPAGFEISISQDGIEFTRIPFNHTEAYNNAGQYELRCDVDYTLRMMGWTNARYMRIGVKADLSVGIDAVEVVVDRPIESTTCMIAGKITYPLLSGDYDTIIMGTVDGQILAYDIGYEDTLGLVTLFESYSDQPKFTHDSTVRDIVQLDGRGRMPTWRPGGAIVTDGYITGVNFEKFSSYAMFDSDLDGDQDIAAIIDTTGSPMLIYLRNTGDDETPVYLREAGFFNTNCNVSMETLGGVLYAAVEVADVNGDIYPDVIVTQYIWADDHYEMEIRFLEGWGMLEEWRVWPRTYTNNEFYWVDQVVKTSPVVPRMSFHDMDHDGDLDLTLGAEKLYYFIQESINPNSYFQFLRRDWYYEDINDDQDDGMVFGKVGTHDFDFDFDWDLTVSHGWENFSDDTQDPEASMLTYYENVGTILDPVWEKNRRVYEPDFRATPLETWRGMIEPQFVDLDDDDILDMVLMRELDILRFYAKVQHDTFLTATNPYIHMIEIEKKGSDFGFEIFDSWDTSEKFDDWSLTVEIADTDEDGREEVIVGSMDQNIYTFEQVANNTYRRAWRSPDFFSLRSDGKNLHNFWDDVESMAIGDQDLDGKQEIIVCAGVEIFVYENVENDVYELVWKEYWIDWGVPGGTHHVPPTVHDLDVVGVDEDLDRDGKPEIIVGGGNLILVYENVGDNNYTAVWGAQFTSHEGGEPHIKAVHTGDFDNNGLRDIAVVGSDNGYDMFGEITNEDGWLNVFENKDDTDNYYEIRYNYVDYNDGAHCVDVADHDDDGLSEIYVGFDWGIQIFLVDAAGSYSDDVTIPTVNATYAIHVGNTDGDSWLELIAGVGPYLVVFEQTVNISRAAHSYDMVWNTTELRDDITDIAIGDTDHDNILEIVATARMGNVYGFEWRPNVTAEAEPLLAEYSLSSNGGSSATESEGIMVAVLFGTELLRRRLSFY